MSSSSRSHLEAAKVSAEAWALVIEAQKELLAEKRQLHRLRVGPSDGPRLRANYRVLVAAGSLHILLEKYKGLLGANSLVEPRRSLTDLPTPSFCRCGCGRLLLYTATGRLPKFSDVACRKRAFRRSRAGLPEFTPRVEPGGRMKLAERVKGWSFNRHQMANMLTHDLDLMRMILRGKETATFAQVRRRLRAERQRAGLRPSSPPKRSPFTPEYFARGLPVRRTNS
jgi:hypothetical protein